MFPLLHFCFRITLKEPWWLLSTRAQVWSFQSHLKNRNYFGRSPPFLIRIIASKMLIFEVRLHLKEPLVATFDETCAFTSGKSVVVQEMDIPKLTQKYKFLWSHFFSLVTLFLKIIVSNMLIFEIFCI